MPFTIRLTWRTSDTRTDTVDIEVPAESVFDAVRQGELILMGFALSGASTPHIDYVQRGPNRRALKSLPEAINWRSING